MSDRNPELARIAAKIRSLQEEIENAEYELFQGQDIPDYAMTAVSKQLTKTYVGLEATVRIINRHNNKETHVYPQIQ